MFEALGNWVATTPEAEAKLLFDRHAQHHAWRARQWWDRLPVIADVSREALCTPTPRAAIAAEQLRKLEGTTARLAGTYRFAVPRLAGAYRRHRLLVAPMSDGSTLRCLDLVEADLARDWLEGELALQLLLDGPTDAQTAAKAVANLEASYLSQPHRRQRKAAPAEAATDA
jgi:hypothetical protein